MGLFKTQNPPKARLGEDEFTHTFKHTLSKHSLYNNDTKIMSGEGGFDDAAYDRGMEELTKGDGEDNVITEWTEVHETFDTMNLRGIYAYGFEKPSAIQQRGIVPFAKGLDVIQQAQSGTGKTATFCAGILQSLNYELEECQALVLAPTRELAQQIEKVMRALGDYLQVKCHACVGGTSVREDQRILQAGVHVVVGTPGRVYDMLRRRALKPDSIKIFSLDEADEMLSTFQGSNLRHFPIVAAKVASWRFQCDYAAGSVGNYSQVYDQAGENFGQERRIDFGRYQAILRQHRQGRVEARNVDRFVRNVGDHAVGYLRQHEKKSRLVDGQDEIEGFHGFRHARGHGPKHSRYHHERISLRLQSRFDHD